MVGTYKRRRPPVAVEDYVEVVQIDRFGHKIEDCLARGAASFLCGCSVGARTAPNDRIDQVRPILLATSRHGNLKVSLIHRVLFSFKQHSNC
jgi:hypothetical protein